MDNKKLFKFLYKDIAEIEELFAEKGSEGFDEFEIEFVQSRFTGAKQLIQILSEKENKQLKKIRPRPAEPETKEELVLEVPEDKSVNHKSIAENKKVHEVVEVSEDEEKRLQSLSEFESELKGDIAPAKEEKVEQKTEEAVKTAEPLDEAEATVENKEQPVESLEKEEVKEETTDSRLGDSFVKEKSVNDLLGGEGNNLEHKISNSPVENINAAIGINDRYQYIRELFEGSADSFNKTVADLDQLGNIKEAVNYLQENFKWKKNETSLKFVNLVKRRFPNG